MGVGGARARKRGDFERAGRGLLLAAAAAAGVENCSRPLLTPTASAAHASAPPPPLQRETATNPGLGVGKKG